MTDAKITAAVYLDSRRPRKDGTYPVRLRIYSFELRDKRYYPLNETLTLETYRRAYETAKPRNEYRALHLRYKALEQKALKTAETMDVFSFDGFERLMFIRTSGNKKDVFNYYKDYIDHLRKYDQVSTADVYDCSRNSLANYIERDKKKIPPPSERADRKHTIEPQERKYPRLLFHQIGVEFLKGYELWMRNNDRSPATIGIYLRPLRTLYLNAIEQEHASTVHYPFGRRKYQIPSKRNVKKALSKAELRTLFHHPTAHPLRQEARAFWFLSLQWNGLNLMDVALLRRRDIQGEALQFRSSFEFVRSKTINTSKKELKPITAYNTAFSQAVIERYGSTDMLPDAYVFDILQAGMNATQRRRAVKNFTRKIDTQIQNLAKEAGIRSDVSFQFARHSFSTTALQNGATMEQVMEAMGHADMNTTQNYFAGFTDATKEAMAVQVMDFTQVDDAHTSQMKLLESLRRLMREIDVDVVSSCFKNTQLTEHLTAFKDVIERLSFTETNAADPIAA